MQMPRGRLIICWVQEQWNHYRGNRNFEKTERVQRCRRECRRAFGVYSGFQDFDISFSALSSQAEMTRTYLSVTWLADRSICGYVVLSN